MASRLSWELCPGVVSSLDVALSLIQLRICLYTQGRHREIRGVREGNGVREELSRHIWVDGTHGESSLEGPAVSPSFFCMLFAALNVPQHFLICYCKIHISIYPFSSSLSHLYFLFLPHQCILYSLQSPPCVSKAIPDVAVQAPIAFCHFFFFQPLLQEVGPFGKKERGVKEGSRRVQGCDERGKTKLYYWHSDISYHMCACVKFQLHGWINACRQDQELLLEHNYRSLI